MDHPVQARTAHLKIRNGKNVLNSAPLLKLSHLQAKWSLLRNPRSQIFQPKQILKVPQAFLLVKQLCVVLSTSCAKIGERLAAVVMEKSVCLPMVSMS